MFECGLEGITLKVVKESQFTNAGSERNIGAVPTDIDKSPDNLDTKSTQNTPRMSHSSKMTEKEKISEESEIKYEDNDSRELSISSKDTGNVSSCNIEFKVVWFNFAAPPRVPITRKIDYTR